MKSCLTILACLVVFIAIFGLGCKPKEPTETDANAAEPASSVLESESAIVTQPAPPATADDEAAVTVNGVVITEGDVRVRIEQEIKKMNAQGAKVPSQFIEQYKKQRRQQVLEEIIAMTLLDEQVKKANIVVTEEEIADQINKIASKEGLSLDDFKALIQAYGQNFEQWKQKMQFQKGLSYQKFFEAKLGNKINITEDDAKKYYAENKKRFETPEQVRASHILIRPDTTDPNIDPNEAKAAAKTKTEELLQQIKNGADLAELAKAYSSCPSGEKGGDLNYFSRGQMVPAFDKAAFELEVGQVSNIVETKHGYHIIKVTDHKPAGVTTFEEAKDGITNELTGGKRNELANQYIESLKTDADVVYPAGKEPERRVSPAPRPDAPKPTPKNPRKTIEPKEEPEP